MRVIIDIGNTNISFAFCRGPDIIHAWRMKTDPATTSDQYAVFLSGLMQRYGLSATDVGGVVLSSVVPDANRAVHHFLGELFPGSSVHTVRPGSAEYGITIDLERPSDLGADRLANALAVKMHYSMPAVVVDFGTATNFDVIGAGGVFMGGVIAPGVQLAQNALHAAAAKLPRVSAQRPKDGVIGKGTIAAMQSGLFYGTVAMVSGVLERMASHLGTKPVVIATGGLASFFADENGLFDYVDDQLTLKGLNVIAQNVIFTQDM